MERHSIERLANYQLQKMIQKGKNVDMCKKEWKRRWGMEYPYYKNIAGVYNCETGMGARHEHSDVQGGKAVDGST
ncbi:hypothetical protein SAMN05192534_12428 [Alteribacillus persepolensis]|uniref:Uncharacterized protein n=2 Tax=Alteribacillus persepolensis TaxID=568899 RepID=A0A1G8IHW2_9BACI|nr:hypothetical protein SAMN05192534_12428 [Alteribacillus persepolensis]